MWPIFNPVQREDTPSMESQGLTGIVHTTRWGYCISNLGTDWVQEKASRAPSGASEAVTSV